MDHICERSVVNWVIVAAKILELQRRTHDEHEHKIKFPKFSQNIPTFKPLKYLPIPIGACRKYF